MKIVNKPTIKFFVILLLAILILTPGFYRNQWLAAGKARFYELRVHTEHMVLARLVESRHSGVLSYGALLGFGIFETGDFDPERMTQVYKDNGDFISYAPYTSHPGIQGIVFSLFEQLTDSSSSFNLRLFHAAISLFTALMLGLFVYWTACELGWLAGALTLVSIAVSEWITMFGGNIYWNLWAFYLPLVAASFYLMKSSASENYNQLVFGTILAMTMLIKCLFTGFEFITTALIMPLMPLIFYAIRDSWGWTKFLVRSLKSSVGLLAGMAAGLLTLLWQIAQLQGGFQEAAVTIIYTLGKRTYGDPSQYAGLEAISLKAKLLPVLATYVNGRAINLSRILHMDTFSIEISYLALFISFLCFTVFILVARGAITHATGRATAYALVVTTWASIAAPLSWFILFKAHSFIHTMLNFMIWQMPFTLYGFALCGFVITDLFERKTT